MSDDLPKASWRHSFYRSHHDNRRIHKALEDIDNGIFPTDGIPADEALRRARDAANSRIEKDDES